MYQQRDGCAVEPQDPYLKKARRMHPSPNAEGNGERGPQGPRMLYSANGSESLSKNFVPRALV